MADLCNESRLAEKLRENLDYHNFVLVNYLKAQAVDYQKTLDDALSTVSRVRPMVADVSSALYAAHRAGANLLFEGAQGSLLDVDHGTYPFVTSSNCVAGNAAAGSGVGPNMLHYVLGITKAYTTPIRAKANTSPRLVMNLAPSLVVPVVVVGLMRHCSSGRYRSMASPVCV